MARVSSQFVSVGVNRVVNALDWGDNGLIAFCGHRIICIYDPEVRLSLACSRRSSNGSSSSSICRATAATAVHLLLLHHQPGQKNSDKVVLCVCDPQAAEVVATLTGHTGQVNCVKWLPGAGGGAAYTHIHAETAHQPA